MTIADGGHNGTGGGDTDTIDLSNPRGPTVLFDVSLKLAVLT